MKGQGLIEPQMKIKPEEMEIRKRDKNFASHQQNGMVPRIPCSNTESMVALGPRPSLD